MTNFFDFILQNPGFKKIELDDLVLVRYECPIDQEVLPVWTQHDLLLHCLSGKKTWKTCDQTVTVTANQSLFIPKGAQIVHQSFEESFCLLMIFIKGTFRERLKSESFPVGAAALADREPRTLYPVQDSPALYSYYLSLLSYLQQPIPPSSGLMEVKLLELIHILAHQSANHPIIGYLLHVQEDVLQTLRTVMQQNFMYNLSLSDYARLCNRSLSSFKRDFIRCFGRTPGKWLSEQRLERAAALLRSTKEPVTQVAFDCGFEDASHFSKAFKRHFAVAPAAYRQQKG